MADFNSAIVKTLEYEGGAKITEIAGDAGGLTKYGICQRSYPTVDIRNLTELQARAIYKRDYWDRLRCDQIDVHAVAASIFDCAVNMGVVATIELVQKNLNSTMAKPVAVDGVMGDMTVAAINRCAAEVFIATFALLRIARYAAICSKRPQNSKFLLGWVKRALGSV